MPVADLHGSEELKALAEEALERLDLWPELHGQATSVRYSLEVGGKRVRPVIALAVGEALGAPTAQVMPAALAI
jgi:geranylgeranyl pyrophosphate synthase